MIEPLTVPPITGHRDYQALLRVCEALVAMDPPRDTVHGKYLLALATALEAFELKHFLL